MRTIVIPDHKEDVLADTLRDRPFKMAMALFAMYSGISGLIGFGASNEIFDAAVKYSYVFNILFFMAGLGVLVGVITKKMNVEAAGLLLVSTSLMMRLMATLALAGWDQSAHNLLILSVLFSGASIVRLWSIYLITHHTITEKQLTE